MQEKAWSGLSEQYLLIKSPPAFGKSQALMLIALDKRQALIVVRERWTGASCSDEPLSHSGFPCDRHAKPQWNLSNTPGTMSRARPSGRSKRLECEPEFECYWPLRINFEPIDAKLVKRHVADLGCFTARSWLGLTGRHRNSGRLRCLLDRPATALTAQCPDHTLINRRRYKASPDCAPEPAIRRYPARQRAENARLRTFLPPAATNYVALTLYSARPLDRAT